MLSRIATLGLVLSTTTAALVIAPRDASACGGCFAPPVDNTVVSYHRMVLSVSAKETTLYDQITYSGSPSSFAWVLPIQGTAKVGVSADMVFQLIDQNTKTQWIAPPRDCPAPPYCPSGRSASEDSAGAGFAAQDAGAAVPNAVEVLKEETVGPYETVQLKSTSEAALTDWLTGHGYAIPTDIQPLIATYVSEGFDFLALKLVPGNGIQSMKPVRVTTGGATPTLPLRMVAAGSGASVGITLWVVGEGRWEPQTVPSFVIDAKDVTWTWARNSHDYAVQRAARVAQLGAAAWEIENSIDFSSSLVTNTLSFYVNSPQVTSLPDGGVASTPIYAPELDENGNVLKTSDQVADDDMQALFQGRSSSRVTRMRSDLPRASLATDLALQASSDQALIPAYRQITKEADEPQCPVYDQCILVGQAPRSEAKAKAASSCGNGQTGQFCGGTSGGGGCSIHTLGAAEDLAPWSLAALGLVLAGARGFRRRRSS
jgi:hypothetical protein